MGNGILGRRELLRIGFVGSASALSVVALAGCGDEKAEAPAAAAPAAEKAPPAEKAAPAAEEKPATVEISYLNWAGSEVGEEGMNKIMDAFHASTPHIKVQMENLPFTQAQDKFVTLHAAGALTDAIQIGFWQLQEFYDLGMIREVDSMAAAAGFDWDAYAGPLKNEIEGKRIVVPMSTIVGLNHFNVTTFEDAGVAGPPDTWEEHTETALKITDPEKFKYGLTHAWGLEDPRLSSQLYPEIWQAGGEVENADGTFASNTPEGLKALEYVLSLELEHDVVVPGSLNAVETTQIENFGSGTAGMFYDNSAHLNLYLGREDLVFDVGPPLKDQTRAGFVFGWRNSVAETSKHPQEAFDFLAWIAGVEGNTMLASIGTQVPANKHAKPTYSSPALGALVDTAIKWATFDGAHGAAGLGEVQVVFAREIHEAINGNATAQEVLDATEAKWNAIVG